jgi:hypothetical protein
MKTYTLIGSDGKPYASKEKGTLGGHRKQRLYGRLDCASALRFVAAGSYAKKPRVLRRRGNRYCSWISALLSLHA